MHPSVYPVEDTLFRDADQSPDAPLVVDVAGGLGHDINEFKKFYPNHPGVSIKSKRTLDGASVAKLFSETHSSGSSCSHQ